MPPRIASPWWFRADGAVLPWSRVFAERVKRFQDPPRSLAKLLEDQRAAVTRRPSDVQLRWACAEELGVPFGPFVVWRRDPRDEVEETESELETRGGLLELRWGFAAAIIQVECTVQSGSRAVALFATRTGVTLRETVGAAAVRATAGTRVTLTVRCSGATRAVLVNGSNPDLRVQSLDQVVNDDGWEKFELVGLPVPDPWGGTSYDTRQQGLLGALVDPRQAALQRLTRAGPLLGWSPLTEAGRIAPTWRPPDYELLIKEVANDVLPRIARLYRPGTVPSQQSALVETPPVAPPQSGGRTSSLTARADLPTLSLLLLPAVADPFLALATGFGTGYSLDATEGGQVAVGRSDFLVTAEYADTPGKGRPAELAAFVPSPAQHGAIAAPTGLIAERAGLVAPEQRDEPWRETIRVAWNRPLGSAILNRPSGASIARYETAGGPNAESLLPLRAPGDRRPFLVVPDGPPATPGFALTALVDSAATIPLGSGGRSVGYAVTVQDAFGVWSDWEDVTYSGTEPPPPPPRLIAFALESMYAGSTSCPATLEVELAVDWADRTPSRVDIAAIFFRWPDPTTDPPSGLTPASSPPPGGFRRDIALPFSGDTLTGPGTVTIHHLDSAGENVVSTPGPLQGNQGRRYRVRIRVPTLDFAVTSRWGVQLWLRTRIQVLGVNTAWSPGPGQPAVTTAASPVPVAPLPPPQPPGVPLGSAPDAQGRSHARVHWSLPATADAEKIVVWEVAETALRQAAGLPSRAPEGQLPGWRLADLRTAYDGLSPSRRRGVFRRLLELPGSALDADVALPPGSTDIHLFAVTTVTSTGVASPWPDGPVPHEQLQAVAAPRLRSPAAPTVRAVIESSGTVRLSLASRSLIPVREFRLYRTRSPEAARRAETMGPAFAVVTAVPPPPDASPDPLTGELPYEATWNGPFDASWDDWFVRAVAVPVDQVPPEAVRGLPSAASDEVILTVLPTTPPDLAPLTSDIWGESNDGVVVFTSSSAPFRSLPLGTHRLSGSAGTEDVAPIELETIADGPQAADATPPAGATAAPVIVRGPRSGGRTPLALWFQRPVATDPVDVVLRLGDPLGRITEQTLTVPGWTPPPLPTLSIFDARQIAARLVLVSVKSDANVTADPPYVLRVRAVPRPFPWLRPRSLTESWPLNEIPTGASPFPRSKAIQARRTTTRPPHTYQLLIRQPPPLMVLVELISPDGTRVSDTATVP